jgi:hypothetical protein
LQFNTGTLVLQGQSNLQQNSSLKATGGTLRINASGAPAVATGVTATVASGATLELDGTTSALTDSTTPVQRVNITNNGNLNAGNTAIAATTTQQVGGIDGSGAVTVADGASLTANHINQNSLVIGNGSTFTLAPSDASGSPMASGLALAGSLAPTSGFVGSNSSLLGVSGGSAVTPALGGTIGGGSAVPEPGSLALFVVGAIGLLSCRRRKRMAVS